MTLVACITIHHGAGADATSGTFAGVPWDAHVAVALPAVRLGSLVVEGLPQGEGCLLAELAMKLVLNSVTTGGHVLAGKIMSNRMIDMQGECETTVQLEWLSV